VLREVVVKQMTNYVYNGGNYYEEAEYHQRFTRNDTKHIVEFLFSDPIGAQQRDKMIRDEGVAIPTADYFLGKRCRIIMEYCELGDLDELLKRRRYEYVLNFPMCCCISFIISCTRLELT
jgi:hypothetical protein